MVFAKVPDDSIREVYGQWAQLGQTTVPPEDENAIREHLCIRAYLVSSSTTTLLLPVSARKD